MNSPHAVSEDLGIDERWQYIKERPYNNSGETVDATADPDGSVTTTVGSDDDTPLQKAIKQYAVRHPDATVREIATELDCDFGYVAEVLRGDHFDDRDWADLTEKQRQILEMIAYDNGLKQTDIASWFDVSEPYVSRLKNQHPHLLEKLQEDVNTGESA